MQHKEPQNTDKYYWTKHIQMKMRHYGISEGRVKRVVRAPKRVEYGVAENTVAVMQPVSVRRDRATGEQTWTQEIWVMYQIGARHGDADTIQALLTPTTKRLISVWRYPGVSKEREGIPSEIWEDMTAIADADML